MRARSLSRVNSRPVPVQWSRFEASMRARGFRTVEEMAPKVGCHVAALYRVKAGQTPSLPLAWQMADAGELELDDLVGRKVPRRRKAAA